MGGVQVAAGRKAMRKLDFIKRALVVVTLSAFVAPQAEAIEVFSAGTSATHLDDGWITQVRGGGGRGGGGMRHGGGGMHRGGGGMHRAAAGCIGAACMAA